MKYFFVLLLCIFTVSSKSQIVAEHTYPAFHRQFGLVAVDSAVFKYIIYNGIDSVFIFNLDHSTDRIIQLPKLDTARNIDLAHISKKLFDSDEQYEFVLVKESNPYKIRAFKENGDSLFGCDNCKLNNGYLNSGTITPSAFVNTDHGAKMMVSDYKAGAPYQVTVYSLPGKLPGSTSKSGVETPSIISGSGFPTSAYPNPSNGQVRIEYKLPEGVSTGEIVISDALGIEVKRYRVGNVFKDILIQKSDLASGSYFYKLVTDKGESETKKLIVLK